MLRRGARIRINQNEYTIAPHGEWSALNFELTTDFTGETDLDAAIFRAPKKPRATDASTAASMSARGRSSARSGIQGGARSGEGESTSPSPTRLSGGGGGGGGALKNRSPGAGRQVSGYQDTHECTCSCCSSRVSFQRYNLN